MARYTVEQITGSDLVGASGKRTGPELAGKVYSTHRTREAAERAAAKLRKDSPLGTPVAVFERQ
jgi:hypothetical protein